MSPVIPGFISFNFEIVILIRYKFKVLIIKRNIIQTRKVSNTVVRLILTNLL